MGEGAEFTLKNWEIAHPGTIAYCIGMKRRGKFLAVLVFAATLLGGVVLAEGVAPWLEGSFTTVEKVAQLPKTVQVAMTTGKSGINMADPDQEFNAGCIQYPGKASRRLIFAAISARICVVHFENGGRAYNCQVRIYSIADDEHAKLLWSGNIAKPAHNLKELRARLSEPRK